MSDQKDLFEFPCRFPLKVMGVRHEALTTTVIEVVRIHAQDLDELDVVVRESSSGKYLSLTVTVNATSRAQLDQIYLALTGHPMVKLVL
ncbi:YbeD family protein [Craterilacuibacter sp.]|uniref:YbeD family protein n=1 Tax=Craterilacuibacter sp. TaxID=2870909 RepID=UPI003F3D7481